MVSKYSGEVQAQFSNAIMDALRRYDAGESPPHPAYHFTTLAGMKGILSTRSIWVTLATASKDPSEITYALSRAVRLLSLRRSASDPSFCAEVMALLDPARSALVSDLGWKVYLACFRTNTNGSGHWKAYGDSGKGAALVFAMRPLVLPGMLFLPVIYDPERQDRVIEEFIDSVALPIQCLSQNCPADEAHTMRKLSIGLTALGIWTLAPLMKAPRFSDEQEWRLIIVDAENAAMRHAENLSKETFHRQADGRDIPFKAVSYSALPLLGIELGLHAPIDVNDPGLAKLANDASPEIEVRISRSRVTPGGS